MAKLYASELSKRTADECLQFFGGFGYMEEYPISRMYRDARVGTIVAGTSEIMLEIISRIMLDDDQGPDPARSEAKGPRAETDDRTPGVAELFQSLPGRYKAGQAPPGGAMVQFTIQGADRPQWTVKASAEGCQVLEGHQGSPDCVVEMDQATYVGLETGRIDPQSAFMTGKIKVSNLSIMMQYTALFRPLGRN